MRRSINQWTRTSVPMVGARLFGNGSSHGFAISVNDSTCTTHGRSGADGRTDGRTRRGAPVGGADGASRRDGDDTTTAARDARNKRNRRRVLNRLGTLRVRTHRVRTILTSQLGNIDESDSVKYSAGKPLGGVGVYAWICGSSGCIPGKGGGSPPTLPY